MKTQAVVTELNKALTEKQVLQLPSLHQLSLAQDKTKVFIKSDFVTTHHHPHTFPSCFSALLEIENTPAMCREHSSNVYSWCVVPVCVFSGHVYVHVCVPVANNTHIYLYTCIYILWYVECDSRYILTPSLNIVCTVSDGRFSIPTIHEDCLSQKLSV